MATPVQLELRSDVDFEAGKREAILGRWDEQAGSLNVEHDADISAIAGEKGEFYHHSRRMARTWRAAHVILAIGTQGNPNRMALPRRR